LVCAQPYPSKIVRLVVPFPPGGSVDVVARAMSQPLSRALKQGVVVENRPGANTLIGTDVVKNAAPDGHTVLLGGFTFIANAALRAKPPYDPLKDFAAVAGIGAQPFVISVHPSLPVKSIKELIALARVRPGELVYSVNGFGTPQHLSGELLKLSAKIDMKLVVFQGGAPSTIAVLGGHAGVLISTIAPIVQHIPVGRLRPLAVTSKERSALIKDVPTMAELGYPEFDITGAMGAFVPGATPKEVVERLGVEIVRAVQLPEVNAGMLRDGVAVIALGPAQYQQFLAAKLEQVRSLGKAAGIKLD
jgi:tripartite-type tricarboxylate transporter receptor subunit TctC